jgi:dTDP-4-dehydrorhamnose reductase
MNILLTGSKGQLGKEVEKLVVNAGLNIIPMDLPEIDITDPDMLNRIFSELKPSIVINAAAYTAVDLAETQKDICYAVNISGPANLTQLCDKYNARLIHISTDYVFDGKGNTPYQEDDPVSPVNVYGHSKSEGEKAVIAGSGKHIVLRTSWLYGRYGKNFVKTMLRMGQEKKEIKVVNDQYGCPTCAYDLAKVILIIVQQFLDGKSYNSGIYQYCGSGITTWYDFAVSIFQFAGEIGLNKLPLVTPIPTSQFPTAAKRPLYTVLDCSKIKTSFGVELYPWKQSLKKTIQQIIESQSLEFLNNPCPNKEK